MRVRRSWLSVVTVLGLLALVCGVAMAQPPGGGPGGGGGQGGRGGMNNLERAWTAMFFELGCTTEQLQNCYATFAAGWNTRKDAAAKARADNDFATYMQAMQQIQQTIDAKLKEVLTAEQQTKWTEYQASQQMPRGNRGGGGGGAGGGAAAGG